MRRKVEECSCALPNPSGRRCSLASRFTKSVVAMRALDQLHALFEIRAVGAWCRAVRAISCEDLEWAIGAGEGNGTLIFSLEAPGFSQRFHEVF
jgi:hypothetical protein